MEKKRKIILIVDLVLIALTVAFIWGHSLVSQMESAAESEQVYDGVSGIFDAIFGAGVITEEILRKMAHFAEFTLLALELNFAFVIIKERRPLGFLSALISGAFVAITDETVQIFSGRGALITDSMLDFSAVLLTTLVFFTVYILRKKRIKN